LSKNRAVAREASSTRLTIQPSEVGVNHFAPACAAYAMNGDASATEKASR
jgi:hypothetical protein